MFCYTLCIVKHYVSLSMFLCVTSCMRVCSVGKIAIGVVVFRSLNNGFWEDVSRIGNVGMTSILLIDVAVFRSHLLMIFWIQWNEKRGQITSGKLFEIWFNRVVNPFFLHTFVQNSLPCIDIRSSHHLSAVICMFHVGIHHDSFRNN